MKSNFLDISIVILLLMPFLFSVGALELESLSIKSHFTESHDDDDSSDSSDSRDSSESRDSSDRR